MSTQAANVKALPESLDRYIAIADMVCPTCQRFTDICICGIAENRERAFKAYTHANALGEGENTSDNPLNFFVGLRNAFYLSLVFDVVVLAIVLTVRHFTGRP